MLSYIIRRLAESVIVIFIVAVCAFSLMHIAPGSPALLLLPDEATEEQIENMEEILGLNRPLPVQFWSYISDAVRGNFGNSIMQKRPISELILIRLPNTATLALGTIITGCLLAIPLGIIAGTHRGGFIDFFCLLFSMIGQSISGMLLGVILIFTFSVKLGWLPSMGTGSFKHLIMPFITMGYPMAAGLTRIARSGMVDTLSEDYITATYAKGISRFKIYTIYALRNAIIPVVTMIGLTLAFQLSGAVITENVFGWSGLGQFMVTSVNQRDYPVVQTLLLLSSVVFVVVNLLVDIINSFIDPRLTLE
jgi:peptide/nickel transport system permease protein